MQRVDLTMDGVTNGFITDETYPPTSCPMCHCKETSLLRQIQGGEIARQWSEQYSVRLDKDFELLIFNLRECSKCGLHFFSPPMPGTDAFYQQVAEHQWYYGPVKWEFDRAIEEIPDASRVLDVGCGSGEFLRRLLNRRSILGEGLEFSAAAAKASRTTGATVHQLSVETFARQHHEVFDVVCAFQVLEHVADPNSFLSGCVELLRPGGTLIISVPNRKSFIRHAADDLLDQPPHHMTRWGQSTLEYLPYILPIRLRECCSEPLADYHVPWFVNCHFGRLPRVPIATGLSYRILTRIGIPLLRCTRARYLLRGHTMFCIYEKSFHEQT